MTTAPRFPLNRPFTKLGEGTYGQVRGYKMDGQKYAVKKTLAAAKKDYIDHNLLLEIAILKYCQHPNVIPVLNAYWLKDNPVLVLPWIDKTLFTRVYQGKLTPTQQDHLAYQLVTGLAYLHRLDIMHRDLKLKNLLVDDQDHLYIADFGMAQPLTCADNYYYHQEVATVDYRAPEIFAGVKKYDKEIDIWSLGVILVELYTRTQIFWQSPRDNTFIRNVGNYDEEVLQLIFFHLGTPEPDTALYQLFQTNNPDLFDSIPVYKRQADPLVEMKNVILHDLILHLFAYEPDQRLTARQILADRYWDPIRTYEAEVAIVDYSCLDNLKLRTYVSKDNFSMQPEITSHMMTILFHWLTSVRIEYGLETQSYFYAIDLIYFFTNNYVVKKPELQLIGIAALYLTDKLFEQSAQSADYIYMTADAYTREQLIDAARQLAQKLKFEYIRATALDYYSQLSSNFRPSVAYDRGVHFLILISYLPMYRQMTLEEAAQLAIALNERAALADGDIDSIRLLVARQAEIPFLEEFVDQLLASQTEDQLFYLNGENEEEPDLPWREYATLLRRFQDQVSP